MQKHGAFLKTTGFVAVYLMTVFNLNAESLPARLHGSWRITHLLPTTNHGCWSVDRAQRLIGSTLTYSKDRMRWQGGDVPLLGVTTRTIADMDLRDESPDDPKPVDFRQLGIHSPTVMEVNLQHEDADITGASTEVPGDSVLLADRDRIVVSACGVYLEATRVITSHGKGR